MSSQRQHVNPSFNIRSSEFDTITAQLFVEAGPMGISLAVLSADNFFKAVVIYSFSNKMNDQERSDSIAEIVQSENLLRQQFHKSHIFWSFPESILVPSDLINADNNNKMLNLVFGDAKQNVIKSDFLFKHNLHNIYRIPQAIHEHFITHLPYATQTHQYSAMVNKDMKQGDHLTAIFYNSSLTLMLSKEGKLQIVQNFAFDNPEDTAYHMLNVCKSFNVQPNKVFLHISGLIDENSALYTSIYKYFLEIVFEGLPNEFAYGEELEEHPPHYFNHLFSFASCV